MPTVLTDGLTLVKAMMPGQIGTNKRWSDATITALLVAADRAVRERLNVHTHEQVITLLDSTASYDLDPEFVGIDLVEFSYNGTDYDHSLVPASYDDLDMAHVQWRTQGSTRPEAYYLASCPGVQRDGTVNYSRIMLYPTVTVAGTSTLRVTGPGVAPVANQATMTASLDVMKRCHVPYVLAVLYASEATDFANANLSAFDSGCAEVRARYYQNQTLDRPSRGNR